MDERRRFARYRVTKIVAYEAPAEIIRGKCLSSNISMGGIQLHMGKRLGVSTELEMKIGIFRGTPPIDASGRVVWQKEITESDKRYFSTGIQFKMLDDPDRDGITAMIIDMCQGLQGAPGTSDWEQGGGE